MWGIMVVKNVSEIVVPAWQAGEEDSQTGIHGSGERKGVREMALSSTPKRLDWV